MILWDLRGRFFEPFCNGRDLLTEHPMDSRSGYQVSLRQLAQTLPLLAVAVDGGSIEHQGLPSDMTSFKFGPPHAGAHPFDDQATLELGDGADDNHDRSSQRAAGVDLLAEGDELDVEPVELIQ